MILDTDRVGEILKKTREAKGVSLEDVANKSNIANRYLQAIESNRFDRLPSDVFARSFIRQYAILVGLEGEEIVELYRRERGNSGPGMRRAGTGSRLKRFLLIGMPAVCLLAIAFYLYYSRSTPKDIPRQIPVDASPAVSPAEKPAEHSPVEPQQTSVEIEFTEPCWISLTLDGKKLFEGIRSPGDTLSYTLREELIFRVGNGGAVVVRRNGKPYSLGGRQGQPLDVIIGVEEIENE